MNNCEEGFWEERKMTRDDGIYGLVVIFLVCAFLINDISTTFQLHLTLDVHSFLWTVNCTYFTKLIYLMQFLKDNLRMEYLLDSILTFPKVSYD